MNPLIYVDPSGNIEFIQEGARKGFQDLREATLNLGVKLSESDAVRRVPGTSRIIASAAGGAAGVFGFVDAALGVVNFGGNLAVGLLSSLAPESEIVQQSGKELTETLDELSNTARVVKEAGAGNVVLQIAKSGKNKFYDAVKGDSRAIAEINAAVIEVGADFVIGSKGLGAASKSTTALKITKEVAGETFEAAGKQIVKSSDEIGQSILSRVRRLATDESGFARTDLLVPEKAAETAEQVGKALGKTKSISERALIKAKEAIRIFPEKKGGGGKLQPYSALTGQFVKKARTLKFKLQNLKSSILVGPRTKLGQAGRVFADGFLDVPLSGLSPNATRLEKIADILGRFTGKLFIPK
jgi:hypothetical protein